MAVLSEDGGETWDATGWTRIGLNNADKYPRSHDTIAFGAPTLMTNAGRRSLRKLVVHLRQPDPHSLGATTVLKRITVSFPVHDVAAVARRQRHQQTNLGRNRTLDQNTHELGSMTLSLTYLDVVPFM